MNKSEKIKSLEEKLNIAQAQFDICDKHRALAEDIVAEQRLHIKELERKIETLLIENETLRADNKHFQ